MKTGHNITHVIILFPLTGTTRTPSTNLQQLLSTVNPPNCQPFQKTPTSILQQMLGKVVGLTHQCTQATFTTSLQQLLGTEDPPNYLDTQRAMRHMAMPITIRPAHDLCHRVLDHPLELEAQPLILPQCVHRLNDSV